MPICHQVAAISVGLLQGEPFLDLNYLEDVAAEVDFNIVMNEHLGIIEVQETAEAGSFSRTQLNQMMDLADKEIKELLETQRRTLGGSPTMLI